MRYRSLSDLLLDRSLRPIITSLRHHSPNDAPSTCQGSALDSPRYCSRSTPAIYFLGSKEASIAAARSRRSTSPIQHQRSIDRPQPSYFIGITIRFFLDIRNILPIMNRMVHTTQTSRSIDRAHLARSPIELAPLSGPLPHPHHGTPAHPPAPQNRPPQTASAPRRPLTRPLGTAEPAISAWKPSYCASQPPRTDLLNPRIRSQEPDCASQLLSPSQDTPFPPPPAQRLPAPL